MVVRPSVRWHLLLAFLGVSSFAVFGGAVAIYSFLKIEGVIERITTETVPTALTSLGLSRRAERLVAAAPALLAAESPEAHAEQAGQIKAEIARLDADLEDLERAEIDPGLIRAIESAIDWLTLNLISLETTVSNGLAVGERRRALGREALAVIAAMRRSAPPSPGRLDQQAAVAEAPADTVVGLADAARPGRLRPELRAIADRLGSVASIEDQASLATLQQQVLASIAGVEEDVRSSATSWHADTADRVQDLRAYIEGQKSVFRARALELDAEANAKRLLGEATKASLHLTSAIDRLVDGAEDRIRAAVSQAGDDQQLSTMVLVAAVVLSLATSVLVVWLYVSRNLIRRLTALSDSMLAISRGDLDTPIPTGGNDEIAGMAGALTVFRATTMERAAAERARANLSRYFSPNLADHLTRHPDTLELRGERRDLTFLCTDLADFTPLVEQLDPTVVVSLMNDYLGGIARIVFDHGGTVDTVVGDAVHAIFGAPLPQPDHAARAVASALAIDRFARRLSARQAEQAVAIGATRIGVHTGSAIVGDFGGEAYFHYTALGDAVNTAARLQSANKRLGTRMCVSADTVALIPDFVGRPIGHLVVKGKVNVVQAFEPVDDLQPQARDTYLAAFRKLEAGAPDSVQSFASYVATYGADPLASFHLKRLLAGEVGATINLESD